MNPCLKITVSIVKSNNEEEKVLSSVESGLQEETMTPDKIEDCNSTQVMYYQPTAVLLP